MSVSAKIVVTGSGVDDLVVALDQVKEKLREGFESGYEDDGDGGSYAFTVEGDEEDDGRRMTLTDQDAVTLVGLLRDYFVRLEQVEGLRVHRADLDALLDGVEAGDGDRPSEITDQDAVTLVGLLRDYFDDLEQSTVGEQGEPV